MLFTAVWMSSADGYQADIFTDHQQRCLPTSLLRVVRVSRRSLSSSQPVSRPSIMPITGAAVIRGGP